MAGKSRKDHRGRVLPPNVSQKADQRYIWRKVIDGRQYVLTDNDLNTLKKRIVAREAEIQNGFYGKHPKITLNEWFSRWMDIYKSNLKITTRELYIKTWRCYIRESRMGGMQVDRIRRVHIVELYRELVEDRGLATSTVQRVHNLLYGCFEDLRQDGFIQSNPSEKAFSKIEKKDGKKREALTVRQQEMFIRFIADSPHYKIYLPMFTFFLGTGVRVGELTGLTWKDIDLFAGTVSINHALYYGKVGEKMKFIVSTPKTQSGKREIPLMMDVRRQLAKQREYDRLTGTTGNARIEGYTDFVFHTFKGMPFTTAGINSLIGRIIDSYNDQERARAEEEGQKPELLPKFSAHILRHTFCTRFCENESNIKVIQEIMGHHDIKTTMDIYSHVTKEKSREVMDELGKKIRIC